ncbi:MAG: rRNA pseudouridine synthase [Clostridiaceae bacterium]|nr:rRNA pseudouridine synthase [Clostridiaceae bacterium]
MEEEGRIRLQKYIALSGITSRRKAEELILSGRVKVNNKIVQTLGEKVDINRDRVEVDGKHISIVKHNVYIILNKPVGYVTTVSDQFNRPTVLDLIKDGVKERVYPVGRLDYDTEGLLILTNDGDLTYKITHPRHNIQKVYIAVVEGIPTQKDLDKFRKGMKIDNYFTSPAQIKILQTMGGKSKLRITIHEGKNRQVRKMCESIGCPVIRLKRIAIGNISLGDLPSGKWRYLKKHEVNYLKNL